ncbi:acetylxylan esterase [Streptomyces sp. NPDC059697]|uniref:acetylxylan esterase n=1 Tax=Streptomyces sp. NPDC059697 TaxID=3346912 RepID=UPI0036C8ABFF
MADCVRAVDAVAELPGLDSGEGQYLELTRYLRRHGPHRVVTSFAALDYFDGVHFAHRATAWPCSAARAGSAAAREGADRRGRTSSQG